MMTVDRLPRGTVTRATVVSYPPYGGIRVQMSGGWYGYIDDLNIHDLNLPATEWPKVGEEIKVAVLGYARVSD